MEIDKDVRNARSWLGGLLRIQQDTERGLGHRAAIYDRGGEMIYRFMAATCWLILIAIYAIGILAFALALLPFWITAKAWDSLRLHGCYNGDRVAMDKDDWKSS